MSNAAASGVGVYIVIIWAHQCNLSFFLSPPISLFSLLSEYLNPENGGQQMLSISDAFIKGKVKLQVLLLSGFNIMMKTPQYSFSRALTLQKYLLDSKSELLCGKTDI